MNMINNGMFTSITDNWATPQNLYDALDYEFHFTLDPCASEENHKAPNYFTISDDGLKQDWGQHTVFMNPPYGRKIGDWVKKAYLHSTTGGVSVALLPCRTDTNWWGYVMRSDEIRFIKGRVKFGAGTNPAPFPSCIVIWGIPRLPVIKRIDTTGLVIGAP